MVLFATTLTDARAVEWITETVGCLFPVEWDEFRAAAQPHSEQRLVDAYYELLIHPEPKIREGAAIAWDHWENAHISLGQHQQPNPHRLTRATGRCSPPSSRTIGSTPPSCPLAHSWMG